MRPSVKILDCTLRDGGYINNWEFKDSHIVKILNALNLAKIDIIECGYLSNKTTKTHDCTLFQNLQTLKYFTQELSPKIQKVVMINLGDFDISSLPKRDKSIIDGIRLAFHKENLQTALIQAKSLKKLNYKVFFQPMITKRYSDLEFLHMIEEVNKLNPYAFYLVDSFGSMNLKEFMRYFILADNNLDKNISLGYHSHNNMQLAFSNAIFLCSQNLKRELIIDSSIYGIGRGAGNLNTELIADFCNKELERHYNIMPLLEIIDNLLQTLMSKHSWGFSPSQYLSASLNLHPNYASYLTRKNTNNVSILKQILEKIPESKKSSFDKNLIQKLYIDFLLESAAPIKQPFYLPQDKKILLIAPGKSTEEYKELIYKKIQSKEYCVIALNHLSNFPCDYYFFSNQKRYDAFSTFLKPHKTLITNNLKTHTPNEELGGIIDFAKLAFIGAEFFSNVSVIILNLLISQGFKSTEFAGLDGYKFVEENYSYDEYDVQVTLENIKEQNTLMQNALSLLKEKIKISFVTPSMFEDIIENKEPLV
ncbi:3-hydroxy-3-methylglutaryl-CoA lyase [Campylobacter sp. MIT 12-5580]|uniref:aldolase catalytic domain-containing protein n=1 Tax=Campylobacter sp. MIT 12-5580 TaxID=2040651 RepID=UPI0010F99B47|nr:aldolase catalytic domain-containing protein [Campylobacter sp. MIT 12-5580]TKX29193.1 3-hydroxy-3-methylglutaryl-CoA lyase [Campylobacter sp. MIT 12-5580]